MNRKNDLVFVSDVIAAENADFMDDSIEQEDDQRFIERIIDIRNNAINQIDPNILNTGIVQSAVDNVLTDVLTLIDVGPYEFTETVLDRVEGEFEPRELVLAGLADEYFRLVNN